MDIDVEPYDFVHRIKSDSLAPYKLFSNITKLLQLIELFLAFAFISWSSIRLPFLFKFSSDNFLAFTSYLMNQHVVFLVGNVLVLVCYILSCYSDSGKESCGSQIFYNEGEESLLIHPKTVTQVPNPKPVPKQENETLQECKKLVIPHEKEITEPETAIKQAAKRIERFQRTQSDLKCKISVKPRRELRGSVTSGREELMKSIGAVDELSNEEFRIAVERFISQQQRILKQQSLVIDGS